LVSLSLIVDEKMEKTKFNESREKETVLRLETLSVDLKND